MKKIALAAHGYINWMGGVDYFLNIVSLFEEVEGCEIIVYLPEYHYVSIAGKILGKDFSGNMQRCQILEEKLGAKFKVKKISPFQLAIIFHSAIDRVNAVGPLIKKPLATKTIKWFSYIWDYQHKYIPELFGASEIQKKDEQMEDLALYSDYIIVGSEQVKGDVVKFHGIPDKKVITLPAMVPNISAPTKDIFDIFGKYKLKKPYFICSNQFWKHKNHRLLFEGFEEMAKSGVNNVALICTGETSDYRNPGHYNELKQQLENYESRANVHILGVIPKEEQIALLLHSIALIQPTNFEGGPGGGTVYEAISLGVPVILSDIPVNLEIDDLPNVKYFKANDSADLARTMDGLMKQPLVANDMLLAARKREMRATAISRIRHLVNNI